MHNWGERLLQECQDRGLSYAGLFDFDHPESQKAYFEAVNRYEQWIENQFHEPMDYLERGLSRRKNPREVFPSLRSVLVVAIPYETERRSTWPKISRYLQGRDYHEVVRSLLEPLAQSVSHSGKFKVCIDTSAVMERTLGALAGLGWIGKNMMLIHPKLGSYFFIGVVFFDQECGEGPRFIPNYCGHCDRCLRACPTDAFTEPYVMDARKCISAFTLENRSTGQSLSTDGWIAGCDVCQEVCPFNTKPERKSWMGSERENRLEIYNMNYWNSLSEVDYRELVKNSAIKRVKFAQMKRNLLLASKASKQSTCKDEPLPFENSNK